MDPAKGNLRDEVNRMYNHCVIRGKSEPEETASAMYEAMGGVTRIDYDPNKTLRIYNHVHNVGISPKGLNKRQRKRLEGLVVEMFRQVNDNADGFDRTQVSSIRLEPKNRTPRSTKHYKKQLTGGASYDASRKAA